MPMPLPPNYEPGLRFPPKMFDFLGDLRAKSQTPGWGKGVMDKLGWVPGAAPGTFSPPPQPEKFTGYGNDMREGGAAGGTYGGASQPPNPALPMNPVLPGLPATTPAPADLGYGGTIGTIFGRQMPPGGPHTVPPPNFASTGYGMAPVDRDYPFPNYLAMMGIGNNLIA